MSLGGGVEPHIFERCMKNNEIAVGWLRGVDLTDSDAVAIASCSRSTTRARAEVG